jgi:5-methylcytosine-specific restriction endonuclease McrA
MTLKDSSEQPDTGAAKTNRESGTDIPAEECSKSPSLSKYATGRNRRKSMPSPQAIFDYWSKILGVFGDPAQHWSTSGCAVLFALDCLAPCFCFACGMVGRVERAHIVAYSLTKDNSVENLHLLCEHCHRESEGISGEAYWRWLRAKEFDPVKRLLDRLQSKAGFRTREEMLCHFQDHLIARGESEGDREAIRRILFERLGMEVDCV